MGACVLILGGSGSGKSASLRNFKKEQVGVLNVMGKPLPFRNVNHLDVVNLPTDLPAHAYQKVVEVLKSGKRKAWVVDDATYLMQNENFHRSKESGYQKFTDMAYNFRNLIMAAVQAPEETITYLMMHTETDAFGHEKVKTIGKMLDEKFCIEGACTVVLEAAVRDGKHVFVSANDGTNLAKAPIGSLPDVMDNDLAMVDSEMREYWEWAPNGPKPAKKAAE